MGPRCHAYMFYCQGFRYDTLVDIVCHPCDMPAGNTEFNADTTRHDILWGCHLRPFGSLSRGEATRAADTNLFSALEPQEEDREMKYRRYYQRVLKDRLTALRKVRRM